MLVTDARISNVLSHLLSFGLNKPLQYSEPWTENKSSNSWGRKQFVFVCSCLFVYACMLSIRRAMKMHFLPLHFILHTFLCRNLSNFYYYRWHTGQIQMSSFFCFSRKKISWLWQHGSQDRLFCGVAFHRGLLHYAVVSFILANWHKLECTELDVLACLKKLLLMMDVEIYRVIVRKWHFNKRSRVLQLGETKRLYLLRLLSQNSSLSLNSPL